ncbi:transposase [Bifidobacterium sp. 82T10]|uniref:Transposase n=1 Tax=Bifidobacterium miconis TaxID=2834435 RepID=A0ABS6WCS8_9BIFI|nr:transposase [Bifidobacterium miconis]MBW3091848.1 transposase [Bifidobacterium miconis]
MMMTGRRLFTEQQVQYLNTLPVVENATPVRIEYAQSFKVDCMRKYRAGGSPSAIFRNAGLPPSLIGYKRIERCFNRWRHNSKLMKQAAIDQYDAQDGLFAASSADAGFDYRDVLIREQALKIMFLEHELERLKSLVPSPESLQTVS